MSAAYRKAPEELELTLEKGPDLYMPSSRNTISRLINATETGKGFVGIWTTWPDADFTFLPYSG